MRVYIATTEGPSEVQRLTPEDEDLRSVVCLNGRAHALPISSAYDAFVRKPTGVIERLFKDPVFRMDVAKPITNGSSWQLGAFASHALFANGQLAEKNESAVHALWLTGEVDSDLNVRPVDNIEEKIRRSDYLFEQLASSCIPLTLFLAPGNAEEAQTLTSEPIKIIEVSTILGLCRELDLPEPQRAERVEKKRPSAEVVGKLKRLSIPRPRRLVLSIVVLGIGVLIGLAGLLASSIWSDNYSKWKAMDDEGAYQTLDKSLVEIAKGNCLTCKLTAKVFSYPMAARVRDADHLSIEATEIHAPKGSRCLSLKFGDIQPQSHLVKKVDDAPSWQTRRTDSLCQVEYRIQNTGSADLYIWGYVYRLGLKNRFPYNGRLKKSGFKNFASGEFMELRVAIPPKNSGTVMYQLISVSATKETRVAELDQLLYQARKAYRTNWHDLAQRLNHLGVAVHVGQHQIAP